MQFAILANITLSVFLISLAMTHACSRPCQFSSTARAGLTRHQTQCPIYRTAQSLRMEQRRAKTINKVPIHNLELHKERIDVSLHCIKLLSPGVCYVDLSSLSQNRAQSTSNIGGENPQNGEGYPSVANVLHKTASASSCLTPPIPPPLPFGPMLTWSGRPQ